VPSYAELTLLSAGFWILALCSIWLNKNFLLIFQKRKRKKELTTNIPIQIVVKLNFLLYFPAFGNQMEHQNTQLSWKIIVKLHFFEVNSFSLH